MPSTTDSIRPVYVPADSDEGAESIADYKPGGLHPTHLGDLLGQDDRYKVVHKLGHGGFGTVWLCRDLQHNRWRAVKILAADHSTGHCADLKICEMLEHLSPKERNVSVSHVVIPEEHFWHEGPNGKHLCVVMPVLGPNLEDAGKHHHFEEEPLKRICYQIVLAMKFLHDRGICHGDFRPNNFCYVLKGLDDLDEEQIMRVLGRPNLLCYVDDDEFDWRSDYAAEAEEEETFYEEDITPQDDVDDDEDVVPSPESEKDEDADASADSHEPRYIVIPPNDARFSGYISDDIAVIDFGESFLASDAPNCTGIPQSYYAPEGFFENSGTFGFGSDIWALGCSIFEIRRSGHPFLSFGLWGLVSCWEDLNGPLPEPYRSSFAKQADVPEDPSQWATLSIEERKEREAEHMGRAGVPGNLHMLLLLERRFVVPLAEGEVQPPPPPPGRGHRGSLHVRPGYKELANEMSEKEALELLDLFKKIFAWKPEDRIRPAEILSHPWFNSCREGNHLHMAASHSESMEMDVDGPDIAEVPDCGIFMYLPTAVLRLLWPFGRGGW